jgi:hypothetical protein
MRQMTGHKTTRGKTRNRKPRTGNRPPLTENVILLNSQGHRDWASMTDENLVRYAKRYMKENGISGRRELYDTDQRWYYILRKRGLLDKIGFEGKMRKTRNWKDMEDNEIIEVSKRFIEEKGITGRSELQKADQGLCYVLRKRKLLDELVFEKKRPKRRQWNKMSDEELIEHAKRFMKENAIRGRGMLSRADRGMYDVLRKRKLLDKLVTRKNQRKRRPWNKMQDEEIIDHAKRFMEEQRICGRTELRIEDVGLYGILVRRRLLGRVWFEEKKRKEKLWKDLSNEELIKHVKMLMKDKGINGRHELKKADQGLYCVLWRRGLLDCMMFERKKRKERPWKQMKNEEIIEYTRQFMREKGICRSSELKKADQGLYLILMKRNLLNGVFQETPKKSESELLDQLRDAVDLYLIGK